MSRPIKQEPHHSQVYRPFSRLVGNRVNPNKRANSYHKPVLPGFSRQPWAPASYKQSPRPVGYGSNFQQNTVRPKRPWGRKWNAVSSSKLRRHFPVSTQVYPRPRPAPVKQARYQIPQYKSAAYKSPYQSYTRPAYQGVGRSYQSYVGPHGRNVRRGYQGRYTPLRTRYRIPSVPNVRYTAPHQWDTNSLSVLQARVQIPRYQSVSDPSQILQRVGEVYQNTRALIPSYLNTNYRTPQTKRLLRRDSLRRSRLWSKPPGKPGTNYPGYWNSKALARYRVIRSKSQKRDQESNYEDQDPAQNQPKVERIRSNAQAGSQALRETPSNELSSYNTTSNITNASDSNSSSNAILFKETVPSQSTNKLRHVSKTHGFTTNDLSVQSSDAYNASNSNSSSDAVTVDPKTGPLLDTKPNHASRSYEGATNDSSMEPSNGTNALNQSSSFDAVTVDPKTGPHLDTKLKHAYRSYEGATNDSSLQPSNGTNAFNPSSSSDAVTVDLKTGPLLDTKPNHASRSYEGATNDSSMEHSNGTKAFNPSSSAKAPNKTQLQNIAPNIDRDTSSNFLLASNSNLDAESETSEKESSPSEENFTHTSADTENINHETSSSAYGENASPKYGEYSYMSGSDGVASSGNQQEVKGHGTLETAALTLAGIKKTGIVKVHLRRRQKARKLYNSALYFAGLRDKGG